jgi:hydrogenase maturation factor HypF (carbamoyltransferase family)/hydrogenase maturation factor
VPTSSMGRLFDAVSSLLGLRHVVSYEAQAAIELEAAAATDTTAGGRYHFGRTGDQLDPSPVVRAIVDDLRSNVSASTIAAAFHAAVAELIADACDDAATRTGLRRVGLCGGVFQNVLLLRLARAALETRGFEVLHHRVVPPNDGGLALGQVAIARARDSCRDGVCITCSDLGEVGTIRRLIDSLTAVVKVAGREQTVDVSLIDAVSTGDTILVHAGVAIALHDPEER